MLSLSAGARRLSDKEQAERTVAELSSSYERSLQEAKDKQSSLENLLCLWQKYDSSSNACTSQTLCGKTMLSRPCMLFVFIPCNCAAGTRNKDQTLPPAWRGPNLLPNQTVNTCLLIKSSCTLRFMTCRCVACIPVNLFCPYMRLYEVTNCDKWKTLWQTSQQWIFFLTGFTL